eukprot:8294309-Alexandrium_andersonii.AAC.1
MERAGPPRPRAIWGACVGGCPPSNKVACCAARGACGTRGMPRVQHACGAACCVPRLSSRAGAGRCRSS